MCHRVDILCYTLMGDERLPAVVLLADVDVLDGEELLAVVVEEDNCC